MADAPANDNVQYRIGMLSAFFIVATAVFFDGIGFLLMLTGLGEIVTELIGICGSILFFVWFLFLGVNFMSGKSTAKLGVMGAGTLIELIPFINGISPTFTIETVGLIAITRKEDREKAEKKKSEQTKQSALQQQSANRTRNYFAQRRQIQQRSANDDAIEEQATNDNEQEQQQVA